MKYLNNKIAKLNLQDYENNPDDCLTCAYYIPLTPSYGFKLYTNKYDAETTFFRQGLAYKLDFGPKCFGFRKYQRYYGYITQHVDTKTKISKKDFKNLMKKVALIGWSHYDYNRHFKRNVGILNKKPVVFDFDDATIT